MSEGTVGAHVHEVVAQRLGVLAQLLVPARPVRVQLGLAACIALLAQAPVRVLRRLVTVHAPQATRVLGGTVPRVQLDSTQRGGGVALTLPYTHNMQPDRSNEPLCFHPSTCNLGIVAHNTPCLLRA